MKKKKIGCGIIFILLITGLYIIWIELNKIKHYDLGEIPVQGIDNYSVFFQQEVEPFEPTATISGTFLYKGKVIKNRIFLSGTHDFDRRDALDFKAKCIDSIIYILFIDSTMIEYYDLKQRNIPFDSIYSFLLRSDDEIKRIQ